MIDPPTVEVQVLPPVDMDGPEYEPYSISDCRILVDGEELAPFSATIIWEDLDEEVYVLSILFPDGVHRTLEVTFAQFDNSSWLRKLGTKGMGRAAASGGWKTKLKAAIAAFSKGVTQPFARHMHLGWSAHADTHYYRPKGSDLDSVLAGYDLPDPPVGPKCRAAVLASLQMLEVLPDRLAIPLLGAIYRAPLCLWDSADAVLLLHGKTGSKKSGLLAEAQAHFGAFRFNRLPASFEWTPASLFRTLHLARDTLVTIDDLDPGGGGGEVRSKQAKAARIIRTVGNGGSRGRLSAGGSASDNFEPRAMVAMTAEYVPSVTSLRARLVLLGVGSDEVDVATLIRLGQHHEQYRLAMAAYVCWLRICSALKSQFIPRQRLFWTRQLGRDWTGHDRLPGNYAMLMTGITYLDFFLHHVFDGQVPDVAKDLQGRAAKVFLGLMKDQQRLLTEEDVPTRFMRLLRSAINQKRVHLALPDGGAPDCATAWGWRTTVKGFRARGTLIGWLAGREGTAYFDPGALFSAVRQEASRQGEPIALPRRAIFNQLREEGLLLEGNSGFTLRRTVEGRSQAVVWLDLERATERASGGVSD